MLCDKIFNVINIFHARPSNKDLCCAMKTCKFAGVRCCGRPEVYMTRRLKAESDVVVAPMVDVTVHTLQLLSRQHLRRSAKYAGFQAQRTSRRYTASAFAVLIDEGSSGQRACPVNCLFVMHMGWMWLSCFVRRDPPSSAKMKKRVSTCVADCRSLC